MKVQLVKKSTTWFVRYKKWYSIRWMTVGINHNFPSSSVHDESYTRKTKEEAEEIYERMKGEIKIVKSYSL